LFNRVEAMFKQSSQLKMLCVWSSDSGMLPGRALQGIVKQFYSSIVKVSRAKVITIEFAQKEAV
jgi:hypothetical protein